KTAEQRRVRLNLCGALRGQRLDVSGPVRRAGLGPPRTGSRLTGVGIGCLRMLVDSQKLQAVRDVIDVCLVEMALEQGLSRLGAAAALVDRMGFAIRLLPRDGQWVAYAISREV